MSTQGGSNQYGKRNGLAKRFRFVAELQANNPTTDDQGGIVDNWETVVEKLRCDVSTKPGLEILQRNSVVPIASSFVTFRWRSNLAVLTSMRFVFRDRTLYAVSIVDPDETRRVLVASCSERAA